MEKAGERYGVSHCSAVTRTRTWRLCAVVALWGLMGFGATDVQAQENPDFDGNGKVEFTDFLIFAAGFGKKASEEGFDARLDLGGNGAVDFEDFLIFVAAFSQSGTETSTASVETDSTGVWSTRAQLLEPNSEMAVAQLDCSARLFLCLGRRRRGWRFSPDGALQSIDGYLAKFGSGSRSSAWCDGGCIYRRVDTSSGRRDI